MATPELRDLRHQYKAAYTSYLSCVQGLSDASQKGELPSPELLAHEEQTFRELAHLREALVDAMFAHTEKAAAPVERTDAA